MVARNDIYWADLGPPAGRRPVCVLTRDAAIDVLTAVACAPITRTIRGIRSEVELGPEHGLPEACVISCDSVITIPLDDLDDQPVGHLDEITRARLDQALRYALDIVYRASPGTAISERQSQASVPLAPDSAGSRAPC